MSDLRPKATKVYLDGKEYGMRFTLNVIDEVQDHFDIAITDLTDILKGRRQIAVLRFLLTALINENIDCEADEGAAKIPHLDEKYVGRLIGLGNIQKVMDSVMQALSTAAPESDGVDDPNAASE